MKEPHIFRAWTFCILLGLFTFSVPVFGQILTIDAGNLDHLGYRFVGPGVDETWSDTEAQEFELTESGDCYIYVNPDQGLCAIIKLELSAEGAIESVLWTDGDSSQSGGTYQVLPSSLYSIISEGSELQLTGNSFTVSMSGPANDSLSVEQFDYDAAGGTFTCLPGDFSVSVAGDLGQLSFECDTAYAVQSNSVEWLAAGDTLPASFNEAFWQLSGEGSYLILTGEEYLLDLRHNADQYLLLDGLESAWDSVAAGDSLRLYLLPGTYSAALHADSDDSLEASLRFSMSPETAEVNEEISWKDEKGSQTSGSFESVDAGVVYRGRKSISFVQILPEPEPDISPQYARLGRETDGGYYLTQDSKLRFKYDEWYNESGNLRYAIRNMNNQDETPATSLAKSFGPNWLELDLSTAGLTTGHYYILDVWNAKGDHRWIRFRKD